MYFAADREDVDAEDTQYTDILLACTRHLLVGLQQILRLKSPVIQSGQGNQVEGQKMAETLTLTGSVLDRGKSLILQPL